MSEPPPGERSVLVERTQQRRLGGARDLFRASAWARVDPVEVRPVDDPVVATAVLAHPDVVFTAVWVAPRTSWCGDDMLEVWAVYDGDTDDLAVPSKPSLDTRIQDILWNLGVDAAPSMHLVARADAKDLKPETV